MTVVIQTALDAEYNEKVIGLAHSFQSINTNVIVWEEKMKPAFDLFDEVKPQLFIGPTSAFSRSLTKVASNIKTILVEHQSMSPYIGNRPTSRLESFANPFLSHGGGKAEEFLSDMTICDLFTQDKFKTWNEWLSQFWVKNVNYNFKIFCPTQWGHHKYCGFVDKQHEKNLLHSATITPYLSEDPNDQPSCYPYNLLLNKCFVITNNKSFYKKFSNGCVLANNREEFKNLVDHYLKYPNERLIKINNGYLQVCKEHTSIDRLRDLINLDDKVVKEIKEKLGLVV